MNQKKTALGKGLASLLEDLHMEASPLKESSQNDIRLLPIDSIKANINQPRKTFNDIESLSQSIEKKGVLQPILVFQSDDNLYEIIAGERRFRAAKMAGLFEIPALIRNDFSIEERKLVALLENIQRDTLNPIEEGKAFLEILEHTKKTHQELSELLSVSRAYVSNRIRLCELPEKLQVLVLKGKLEPTAARALLGIPREEQFYFARKIIDEGLSVRALESLLSEKSTNKKTTPKKKSNHNLQEELKVKLGYSVKFNLNEKTGKGWIQIPFKDEKSRSNLEKLLLDYQPKDSS